MEEALSAINLIRQDDRVHLVTDGALVETENGLLVSHYAKQSIAVHLNAAVALRGQGALANLVLPYLTNSGASFENFVHFLETGFRAWFEKQLMPHCSKQRETLKNFEEFDLIIAGYSERPRSYILSNIERPGLPAWTLTDTSDAFFMPADQFLIDRFQPETFDPATEGVALVENQRRSFRFGEKSKPFCGIGAFIQATTIDATGIHSRIVHRWPDEIGKPIGGLDWNKTAMLAA
jgi:hypothetical protein